MNGWANGRRMKMSLYSAAYHLYYRTVSRTARVTWQASPVSSHKLWVCWHDALVVVLISFLAEGAPPGLCLIGWDNDRGAVMRDALARLSVNVIQVSDRRGQNYKKEISSYLADRGPCLLTPDGPVGPYHVPKPGAEDLSKATGIPLGCLTYEITRCVRLPRWDRIAIPLPFCRIVIREDELSHYLSR